LVKKVSKRDITGRSPPNVVISPATLCGTIQSFCAPFPLAQPAELAGS
jgi:hypothetical protein